MQPTKPPDDRFDKEIQNSHTAVYSIIHKKGLSGRTTVRYVATTPNFLHISFSILGGSLPMKRTMTGQLACWTTLILLGITSATLEPFAFAAEAQKPTKKLAKRVRRLPPRYAAVVDEKQREEIYKIQEEYQPKIELIENQLKALKKERDQKIAAVLTAEQRKQVEETTTKEKHKSKPPQSDKTSKEEPATPPAKSKSTT
jgi:hypothetical protein